MVKQRGGGNRRGGGGGGRAGPTRSGIEKYGRDDADEFLKLDDDDPASEADASSGVDEEEVLAASDAEEDWGEEEDEGDGGSFKKALRKAGGGDRERDEASAAAREAAATGTVGWKGQDFYGGDDAGGDSSDGGSDEELNFQEAKRLEEQRMARLGGLAVSDPLAVLLGEAADADKSADQPAEVGAENDIAALAAASAAGASARFESLFAAEAEHAAVPRDLSRLSEAKRRSLVKKEAPELVPLLQDFQSKLAGLKELLPLLQPQALARLPKSGAAYLETKAALLLTTLANLSFYVLLRAEGGSVRTHPVVSQLVWLKELHEKVAPLDKRLRPKLRKLLKAAAKGAFDDEADSESDDIDEPKASAASDGAQEAKPRRLGLRERLERLRAKMPAGEADAAKNGRGKDRAPAGQAEPLTTDLLKLPSRKRRGNGADGAPADLDEADPTLGFWMPKSTLGEQLSSVRQYIGESNSRTKQASADQDVEARPRRHRERIQEEPAVAAATDTARRQRPPGIALGGDELDGNDDVDEAEGDLIQQAREASRRKKERKTADQVAREEARLLRQHRPEEVVEGRRKTSKKILANRGLVRQRKETAGNARVTNRKKYEKKVKARRGAVQEMREGAADGATYEGEASGVRTHLKKSRKLG